MAKCPHYSPAGCKGTDDTPLLEQIAALSDELETVKAEYAEFVKQHEKEVGAAEAKLAGGEVTACRSCKGTGYSLGEVTAGRICSVCNGSGSLTHPAPTHNDGSGEIVCDVITIGHSSGFPDHFTRIRVGDRSLTMFMSKIKGRCEYHAAELNWLLNGAKKPDIMDFDDTEPDGLAEYLSHTSGEVTEACIPRSVSDAELFQWAEKRADDAGRLARELLAYRRASLPQDVINLVIAARVVAFEDQSPEALRSLDEASEAFASRVPWDNEPEGEQ